MYDFSIIPRCKLEKTALEMYPYEIVFFVVRENFISIFNS